MYERFIVISFRESLKPPFNIPIKLSRTWSYEFEIGINNVNFNSWINYNEVYLNSGNVFA